MAESHILRTVASENAQFLPTAWQIDAEDHQYGAAVTATIEAERQIPVQVDIDTSLRPKVIDACGMTCTFCHNEGTPVAADNKDTLAFLKIAGPSGRVSVFSETNGVDFIPGTMQADERFIDALVALNKGLGLDELHMTGGEPTLHPRLPELISAASEVGYKVKMTSNGENGKRMIPAAADAGLQKINFSIFGTTPEELAEVQHAKYKNYNLAAAKITALHRSIATALEHGVEVGANIVMQNDSQADRIHRVLDEFEPRLSVRILPDLDAGVESHLAIYKFLTDAGAVPVNATIDAGSSNARVRYKLPDGREVFFKQIRPTRMPETCGDCELNTPDDCKEGYYGVRLYTDREGDYKVGVCLQRMDLTMPVAEFMVSNVVRDVKDMRDAEYRALTDFYSKQK